MRVAPFMLLPLVGGMSCVQSARDSTPISHVDVPRLESFSPARVYLFGSHPSVADFSVEEDGFNCGGTLGKSCAVTVTSSGLRVSSDESGRAVSQTAIRSKPRHVALRGNELFVFLDRALYVAKPPTAPLVYRAELPPHVRQVTMGKATMFALDDTHGFWRSLDLGHTWRDIAEFPKGIGSIRPLTPHVRSIVLNSKGQGLRLESPPRLLETMDDGGVFSNSALEVPYALHDGALLGTMGVLLERVSGIPAVSSFERWHDGTSERFMPPHSGSWAPERVHTLAPDVGDPALQHVHLAVPVGPFVVAVTRTADSHVPPVDPRVEPTNVYRVSLLGGEHPARLEPSFRSCTSLRATSVAPTGFYRNRVDTEVTFICHQAASEQIRISTAHVGLSGISTPVVQATVHLGPSAKSKEPVVLAAGQNVSIGDFGCRDSICDNWFTVVNGVVQILPIKEAELLRVVRTATGIWVVGRTYDGAPAGTTPVGRSMIFVRLSTTGSFIQQTTFASNFAEPEVDGVTGTRIDKPVHLAVRTIGSPSLMADDDLELVSGVNRLTATIVGGSIKVTASPWNQPEVIAFAGNHTLAMTRRRWLESADGAKTFVDVGPAVTDLTVCSLGACAGKDGARVGWDDYIDDSAGATRTLPEESKPKPIHCRAVGPTETLPAMVVGPPSVVGACGTSLSFPTRSPTSHMRIAVPLGWVNTTSKRSELVHTDPRIGWLENVEGKALARSTPVLPPVTPARRMSSDSLLWNNDETAVAMRLSFAPHTSHKRQPTDVEIETFHFQTGKREHFSRTLHGIGIGRNPFVRPLQKLEWLSSFRQGASGAAAFWLPLRVEGGMGVFAGAPGTTGWALTDDFETPLALSLHGKHQITLDRGTLVSRPIVWGTWPTSEVLSDKPDEIARRKGVFRPISRFLLPTNSAVATLGDDTVAVLTREDFDLFALYKLEADGRLSGQKVKMDSPLSACGPCARELPRMSVGDAHPMTLHTFATEHTYSDIRTGLGLEGDKLCALATWMVSSDATGIERVAIWNAAGDGVAYESSWEHESLRVTAIQCSDK